MEIGKDCAVCGKRFIKPASCSMREWTEQRKCCSRDCGNALKRGRPNPKLGDAHRGKKQSPEHRAKRIASIRQTYAEGNVEHARANLGLRGEATTRWKGENVSYRAVHHRLYSHRGKPTGCELCSSAIGPFEWALKQDAAEVKVQGGRGRFAGRSYSTRLDDYIGACRPCHREYDGRERDPLTGRYL